MVHDHQPPGDVELAEFPKVDMRHLRASRHGGHPGEEI